MVSNTIISSSVFNLLIADLSNGLTDCVTKDGQSTATARIPFAQGIQFPAGSAGSVSAPPLNFAGSTGTGFYSPGADQLAAGIGGSQAMLLRSTRCAFGLSADVGTSGTNENATAVGSSSYGNGANATAVGSMATANGSNATAIGTFSLAKGGKATAVGSTANANGQASTAIGFGAYAANGISTSTGGQAFGTTSRANGALASGFGLSANANAEYATAVGANALADGLQATAIGYAASVSHANSTAVGTNATTTAANEIRLGTSSETVSHPGKLVIDTGNAPANAAAAGRTGQFAWASGFFYVCVATNTWQRVAIATW